MLAIHQWYRHACVTWCININAITIHNRFQCQCGAKHEDMSNNNPLIKPPSTMNYQHGSYFRHRDNSTSCQGTTTRIIHPISTDSSSMAWNSTNVEWLKNTRIGYRHVYRPRGFPFLSFSCKQRDVCSLHMFKTKQHAFFFVSGSFS